MQKLDTTEKLLKRLTDAFGPSSFEEEVAEIVRDELKDVATSFERDGVGSIIAVKEGSAKSPKIMLAGHMDEVGFMVAGLTKQGYIKFNPLGGWWPHNMLDQVVVIRTRQGKDIIGVIGSKAPHSLEADERKKVMNLADLYIDIGATEDTPELATEHGIRVGDPIVPYATYHKLGKDGKMLMNKAWDNRIGVAIMIMVMKELAKSKHPNTYYGVGTVQEELGLRGAGTSAFAVKPDIAFAIDVTLSSDIPGSKDAEWAEKAGKGPSISVIDGSLAPNPRLRDFVIDVAEKEKIPYQLGSLARGGTDGGRIAITAAGTPTLTCSVATRYIHSNTGILHKDDVLNLTKLLIAVIKKLDKKAVAKIRYR